MSKENVKRFEILLIRGDSTAQRRGPNALWAYAKVICCNNVYCLLEHGGHDGKHQEVNIRVRDCYP